MSTFRVASRFVAPSVGRSISFSPVRKDLVQDLYLKELKAYKAPPTPKDAHVAAVKVFTLPQAPSTPAPLTSNLASDLQAFEDIEVDLAPPAALAEGVAVGNDPVEMMREAREPIPIPALRKWRNAKGEVIGNDGKPHPAYNAH
ncbi:ATP synthase complex subunit H-domain-containing protein [Mrakia frigida]|uniref:F1F0 ATP synthase subunit h n=1 Tax=Mrakia frigida TaxID=29902 RepID=UPI003FCC1557